MKNEYAVIFDDWVIGHEWVFLSKIAVWKWLLGSIISFKANFYLKNIIFPRKNVKFVTKKHLFWQIDSVLFEKHDFYEKWNSL